MDRGRNATYIYCRYAWKGKLMQTSVQKWGNSLALRIPKALAAQVGIEQGATVDLRADDGSLVIQPVARPALRLDDLIKGITKKNLHHETDTGEPTGREVW